MEIKDNFIQLVRPYLEDVVRAHKSEETIYPLIEEKNPILFGKGVEEHDLILEMGDENTLCFRCSGNKSKICFNVHAYFTFSESGKRYKVFHQIASNVLTEQNIKEAIQKFLRDYEEEKQKSARA